MDLTSARIEITDKFMNQVVIFMFIYGKYIANEYFVAGIPWTGMALGAWHLFEK